MEPHLDERNQKKVPSTRRVNDSEQGSDQRKGDDPEHGVVEAR